MRALVVALLAVPAARAVVCSSYDGDRVACSGCVSSGECVYDESSQRCDTDADSKNCDASMPGITSVGDDYGGSVTLAPSASCPEGWTAYGAKCFHVPDAPNSWPECVANECAPGWLACVDDEDMNAFIYETFIKNRDRRLWIGLNDVDEGEFAFSAGMCEGTYYRNWDAGEPNGWGSTGEDCVMMTQYNAVWNDGDCLATTNSNTDALPLREVGPHARADGGLRHLEHRRDVPGAGAEIRVGEDVVVTWTSEDCVSGFVHVELCAYEAGGDVTCDGAAVVNADQPTTSPYFTLVGPDPTPAPSAAPTRAPTAPSLEITSVGVMATCVSGVACDVAWAYRGAAAACATLDVAVTDVAGAVVGSTTTPNDGFTTRVTAGDAEVSDYTLTLRCADDAAVAASYDFRVASALIVVPLLGLLLVGGAGAAWIYSKKRERALAAEGARAAQGDIEFATVATLVEDDRGPEKERYL
ncbi:hypothetical protein JL722_1725 [Aureococcus anophagefferens]|nr:hypothetical protein JL722_1725 [Aureococcus anophagefferens]